MGECEADSQLASQLSCGENVCLINNKKTTTATTAAKKFGKKQSGRRCSYIWEKMMTSLNGYG